MKRILLDTSAYARFFAGDGRVLDALGAADTVFLSVVVIGELLAGFRGGIRLSENRAQLRTFMSRPTVRLLEVGLETAEVFSQVMHSLRLAGTPVPINDVWISAQAIETGSVLVTFDGHFNRVPGIRLWESPA